MRERLKCERCGLVQWRQETCRRCGAPSTDEPAADAMGNAPVADPAAWSPAPPAPSGGAPVRTGPASVTTRLWCFVAASVVVAASVLILTVSGPQTILKDEVFPEPLSFEDIDRLCPFRDGTFICQHVQKPGGRVMTVRSPSNDQPMTVRFVPGRLRIQASRPKIGVDIQAHRFDSDLTAFLFSGFDIRFEHLSDFSFDFGNSGCTTQTVRIYRFAHVHLVDIREFFVDVILRCDAGQRAVGRLCYQCGDLLPSKRGDTDRRKRRGWLPSAVSPVS